MVNPRNNDYDKEPTVTLTQTELQEIILNSVAAALAVAETRRNEQSRNGGGNEINHGARVATYNDFMTCKPPRYERTERPVGLLRWLEETKQQANDAMIRTNRRNVLGTTNDEPKGNKRKRSDDLRRTSYSYLMEKYVASPPGSSNGKKPDHKDKLPLCTRCEKPHSGYCHVICTRCSCKGHISKNCRTPNTTAITTAKHGTDSSSSIACFGCGAIGHIKRNFPKVVEVKKEIPELSSCTYCGGSKE